MFSLTYYRYFIIVVATLIFYTNLPTYLFSLERTSIPPLYYIYVLILSLLPFLVKLKVPRHFLYSPLLYWGIGFLVIAAIWFIPTDPSERVEAVFRREILSVIFLFCFLFMFSSAEDSIRLARGTLLVAMLIAIANNVYEFFYPFSFASPDYLFANPGRTAGLYLNANQSGAALIVGMIFTVSLLSTTYRTVYVLLILVAIILTFSRSAMLAWVIVILFFVRQKILRFTGFSVVIASLIIFIPILLPFALDFLAGQTGINLKNVMERLDWFSDPLGVRDMSQEERLAVAQLAWEMFLNNPFFGNGVGASEVWSERSSTHNTYLYFMVDYGIIGAFVLPLLILAVTWKARGEAQQIALPFGICISWFGFFSHNIIQEYYFLISFALMAAMNYRPNNHAKTT